MGREGEEERWAREILGRRKEVLTRRELLALPKKWKSLEEVQVGGRSYCKEGPIVRKIGAPNQEGSNDKNVDWYLR